MAINEMTKGIKRKISLIDVENQAKEMEACMNLYLSATSLIDAIFFTNNKLAIAGLKILQAKGIKIPEKLAVVSFDETDVFDLFYVPITHVKQPLAAIAEKTVELLTKNIFHLQKLNQSI